MNHSPHTSEASRGGGRSGCVKIDAAASHLYLEFNVASNQDRHCCLPRLYMTTLGRKTCPPEPTINSDLITNG